MAEGVAGGEDARDLAAEGYNQELERTLGSFSAFAAGFSYLSILTGMFQNFHLGYAAGGPAFFWTWPVVFLGQLATALCFAELAGHYPLCGGVYQWSRRVGSPATGWLAGWVYLASLVVTLAAVVLALQVTLPQIAPWSQLIGDRNSDADRARNAVVLGLGLIAFSTAVNSYGVGLLAKLNNLGVFSELLGVILLIVLLALHAVRGPAVVLDTQGRGAGLGYFGPFSAAAIMASYVMYGYDTAGTLAEETTEPRRRAPRAILQALAAAGVAGGLVLLFALMAVRDPADPNLSSAAFGLPYLVRTTLGSTLGQVFLWDVVFAITVCALAVHTGMSRLLYAMARDGTLPLARPLAHVSPATRTPVVAVLVSGGLAVLLLVGNINSPRVIEAVTSVSIVWANAAYLLVTAPLLWSRLRGWPARGGSGVPGVFSLGRWGIPVNVLAVLAGLATAINMGWPRPEVYGEGWYRLHAASLYSAGLLLTGLLYYALVQRRKHKESPAGVTDEVGVGPTLAAAPAPAPRPALGGEGERS
jgi:urea carboxylase system permease